MRIYAEFENKDYELRPGLEGQMTIFLTPDAAAASARRPTPATRTAAGPVTAGTHRLAPAAGAGRLAGCVRRTGPIRDPEFGGSHPP